MATLLLARRPPRRTACPGVLKKYRRVLFIAKRSIPRSAAQLFLLAAGRCVNWLGANTAMEGGDVKAPRSLFLATLAAAHCAVAVPYVSHPLRPVRRDAGYATKYALDFGKANSPVREGFTSVTAETLLSEGAEFGWRDAKEVKAYYVRDNYKGKQFSADIFYCPYQELALNELNDDCLWGSAPAEFHLRLAPGRYNVYYLGGVPRAGGFPSYQYFKFDIALNDEVRDTICIPFSTMFENRRYTAEVGGEGLTIRLTPLTMWIIDGLIVYPSAEEKNVEECIIAPLEEDVYLLPPYSSEKGMRMLERVAHEETRSLPELSAEWKPKGYVVFARDWIERVFPNTVPQAAEIGRPVALFATPGEWEPACFTIRALDKACKGVNVRVSPPTSNAGSTIPPENVRLYRVQYSWLSFAGGRGYTAGRTLKAKLAPYLLVEDIAADVPANVCQSYWLNVKIPENADPGVYEGEIRVEAAGRPATALPLRVRVLPFKLKTRPDFVYGVYWNPVWNHVKRNYAQEVMREEGRRREAQELEDFKEHMVQSFNYHYYGQWQVDLEKKTATPTDPTFPGMTEAAQLLERAGAPGPIIGTPIMTLYWRLARDVIKEKRPEGLKYRQQWHRKNKDVPPIVVDLLAKGAHLIQDRVKKENLPEFLYYILDESDPKLMRKLYAAVKQAPGARTYSTSGNYPEDLGPWLDVNCSTGSFLGRGDWQGEARERAERGEYEPWAYPNGAIMGYDGSPKRCRYVYGFYAWKMGLRGIFPWIYTTNNGKGNPFNDFDRDYPDTGFVMPGPDGLILTIRWDGAREGIDDMRYIHTLATLVAQAKTSGNETARGLAAEAESSLAEIKDDVPEDYMGDLPDVWTVHNTQAYRWYIATLIMKLSAALGGVQ